ncbi:MAG: AMP-binding protein, partial [Myxococcales bacterium]|nr:AMP-binding protein [Myxococcales bacterium]
MIDLSRLSSVGEALGDATIMYKSATALIEIDRNREKERISYRELRADAQRVTALLSESAPAGFPAAPGHEEPPFCVSILMSNQSKWLVTATGAFWAGATIVPLDYKLTAPEQVALLRHCRPAVLVTEYSTWRKLDLSELQGLRVLVTEAPDGEPLAGPAGVAVERWEQPARHAFVNVPRRRTDIAGIVYSSGTGGTPKGCQLTHGNYLAQAEVLASMYPMAEGERYFSILPTNHAIDFMCGFIIPFIMGAIVVHQRTLRPQYIVDTMKRYEITH